MRLKQELRKELKTNESKETVNAVQSDMASSVGNPLPAMLSTVTSRLVTALINTAATK